MKIQRFATGVMDDFHTRRLSFQTHGTRAFKTRFMFARTVPRDVYNAEKAMTTLKDGATATLIVRSLEEDNGSNY